VDRCPRAGPPQQARRAGRGRRGARNPRCRRRGLGRARAAAAGLVIDAAGGTSRRAGPRDSSAARLRYTQGARADGHAAARDGATTAARATRGERSSAWAERRAAAFGGGARGLCAAGRAARAIRASAGGERSARDSAGTSGPIGPARCTADRRAISAARDPACCAAADAVDTARGAAGRSYRVTSTCRRADTEARSSGSGSGDRARSVESRTSRAVADAATADAAGADRAERARGFGRGDRLAAQAPLVAGGIRRPASRSLGKVC